MVEETRSSPLLEAMTGLTLAAGKLLSMLVLMTREAGRTIETQKGAIQVFSLSLQAIWRPNHRLLVTASALQALMGPKQLVRSLSVVERRLTAITPEDQLEVPTMVLHVTPFAALLGDRGVITTSLFE